MAVYPSNHGQEAYQEAAALCLSEGDWMFPTYRDAVAVAVMTRGVDPVQVMTIFRGDWHGGFVEIKPSHRSGRLHVTGPAGTWITLALDVKGERGVNGTAAVACPLE